MNPFVRVCYRIFRGSSKLYLRLFNEFKVWGKENIPPGAKIYCSNHFSSVDPIVALTLMKESVHMVLGAPFKVAPWPLKQAEMINALPEHRKSVVPEAVKYLKRGEAVYIFPEGQLNDQVTFKRFYAGLARIYLACPVPIIPIGLVSPRKYIAHTETDDPEYVALDSLFLTFKKYYASIGKPIRFPHFEAMKDTKAAEEGIMEEVKEHVRLLVEDIKTNKFWS